MSLIPKTEVSQGGEMLAAMQVSKSSKRPEGP